MKVLFACGGTAGHIYPAVGVAGAIRSLEPDSRFLFVGAKGQMEETLVPKEGYEISTVTITNISRSISLAGLKHNLKTLRNLSVSARESAEIIRSFCPDIVIGTGGYVCYPVLKQAARAGIPTMVHESNAEPGLTTKKLVKIVDTVMVGFESAVSAYPAASNVVVTGTPVRPYFYTASREEARKSLGIPADEKVILSVWGSLGSDFMNGMMPDLIPMFAKEKGLLFIHSAGKRGYEKLKNALDVACPGYEDQGIDLRAYIYDMPLVMAAADLVLCRSGASTLAELAQLGKPAIFVPSPNVTNHHQEKNARVLEQAGGAKVFLEGQFREKDLYEEAMSLLSDRKALDQMSAAMRKCAFEDSAARIARQAKKLVEAKRA